MAGWWWVVGCEWWEGFSLVSNSVRDQLMKKTSVLWLLREAVGEPGLLDPALVLHVGLEHLLPSGEGSDAPQPAPRGRQSAAQQRQHHAARGNDSREHGRSHACLVGVGGCWDFKHIYFNQTPLQTSHCKQTDRSIGSTVHLKL